MARKVQNILATWTEYIVAMNNFAHIFKRRFGVSDQCIQTIKHRVHLVVEEELSKEGVLK